MKYKKNWIAFLFFCFPSHHFVVVLFYFDSIKETSKQHRETESGKKSNKNWMDRNSPPLHHGTKSFGKFIFRQWKLNEQWNNEMILKLLKSMPFFRVSREQIFFLLFFFHFERKYFSPFLFNCSARGGRFWIWMFSLLGFSYMFVWWSTRFSTHIWI